MRLESVFDNLLKMLSNYDIMYAKSIQKISGTKKYTNGVHKCRIYTSGNL